MYKRRKKVIERAFDQKLAEICNDILNINPDLTIAISKKYIENSDKTLGQEFSSLPVVVCSKPIDQIKIPSTFSIINGYLMPWCDNNYLIKMIYSQMNFIDGEISGKFYKNLYLDIANEEEVAENKKYHLTIKNNKNTI